MATVSGTVKDRTGTGLQRYVTVQKRSTLSYLGRTLSNPSTGAYSFTVPDTSECVVTVFDEAPTTYFDPDAASTAFLLTMQGANGSTTYTDSGPNALSITRQVGTGTITNAITPHSDLTCASFPNDTRLVLPNNSGLLTESSSTPWIVETWARFTDLTDSTLLYSSENTQFRVWNSTQISFRNGYNSFEWKPTTSTIPLNTWVHILWSKHTDDKIRIFLDGVLQGGASSADTGRINLNQATIGEGNGDYMNGYLQDFRVKLSVSAGITANFTPPASFSSMSLVDGGSGANAQIIDRVVPV
jgi:hypothetical protein